MRNADFRQRGEHFAWEGDYGERGREFAWAGSDADRWAWESDIEPDWMEGQPRLAAPDQEGVWGAPYGGRYGGRGRGYDRTDFTRRRIYGPGGVYDPFPGPYTGLGPKGYTRADDRIREEACERLTRHGQVDASEIEVSVENGVITLEGMVANHPQKRMAEDAVEDISGVRDVQNHLHLSRSRDRDDDTTRDSGEGVGRVERVGETGVYPASGPLPPEGSQAEVENMGSWGQGPRGPLGAADHGESELNLGEEEPET
jgi:hypothetical protein